MALSPRKRCERGFGTAPSLLPHALILTNDQRVAFETRDKAVGALQVTTLSHEERELVLSPQPQLPPEPGQTQVPRPHSLGWTHTAITSLGSGATV